MEEEEAEQIKARNRLEDNWKYEFDQKKKRTQEEFDAESARVKRNESLRHETLERGWNERESLLKSKEQEFQNLQAQVAGFDAKLQESAKKAEVAGYASASAKFTHEISLLKKDAESDKKVAEMRANALTSQIASLENQIEDMQKQLISARQDAKEVASEALKSASSRQLADTLQKVVTDGQQGNGKTK
jgi:predicted  nucleic acid-binding Zn-ribbon protein